jgi:hypothetical protein
MKYYFYLITILLIFSSCSKELKQYSSYIDFTGDLEIESIVDSNFVLQKEDLFHVGGKKWIKLNIDSTMVYPNHFELFKTNTPFIESYCVYENTLGELKLNKLNPQKVLSLPKYLLNSQLYLKLSAKNSYKYLNLRSISTNKLFSLSKRNEIYFSACFVLAFIVVFFSIGMFIYTKKISFIINVLLVISALVLIQYFFGIFFLNLKKQSVLILCILPLFSFTLFSFYSIFESYISSIRKLNSITFVASLFLLAVIYFSLSIGNFNFTILNLLLLLIPLFFFISKLTKQSKLNRSIDLSTIINVLGFFIFNMLVLVYNHSKIINYNTLVTSLFIIYISICALWVYAITKRLLATNKRNVFLLNQKEEAINRMQNDFRTKSKESKQSISKLLSEEIIPEIKEKLNNTAKSSEYLEGIDDIINKVRFYSKKYFVPEIDNDGLKTILEDYVAILADHFDVETSFNIVVNNESNLKEYSSELFLIVQRVFISELENGQSSELIIDCFIHDDEIYIYFEGGNSFMPKANSNSEYLRSIWMESKLYYQPTKDSLSLSLKL